MKTFGQRLKKAREKAGYDSAQKFAHTLVMEPPAYRKYERGESQPTLETLIRICDLLQIDMNYLFPQVTRAHPRKPSPGSTSGDGKADKAA